MFNLFNKPEVKSEKNIPSYPKDVMEIHHEFNTAADKLIAEANSVIKEANSKDVRKVSRLEALGFKQAGQVTELKPLLQKAELSKEQIASLEYYRREYPFNKFITEDQVKSICHKYNLVCGDVDRFKGFVPEKNLKEIESFKLKSKDANELIFELDFFEKRDYVFHFSENDLTEYGLNYIKTSSNTFYITASDYTHNYSNRMITKDCERRFSDTRFTRLTSKKIGENKLQICAPVKDMDISGLELTEGYKLTKKHIPDPVVLQPVKNGYLILTAWGDEASDELVVNNINN